jgi:hypothetical protein
MEAARSSETLVNFYQTTWRYNPEDNHLRTHRRENLKSYLVTPDTNMALNLLCEVQCFHYSCSWREYKMPVFGLHFILNALMALYWTYDGITLNFRLIRSVPSETPVDDVFIKIWFVTPVCPSCSHEYIKHSWLSSLHLFHNDKIKNINL